MEELVRTLEDQGQSALVPSESARLLLKAAEVARERLRDPVRAEGLLRQVLAQGTDVVGALKAIRLLCEQRQDTAGLAETLEQLALHTRGPEAAAFWLEAADLYELKLGRRARAVVCCQLASRADPGRRQAFERARRALLADRRYLSVFESLERERSTRGPAGLVDSYVDLAERLVDEPLEHPLARRVLDVLQTLQPSHPRADKVRRALDHFPDIWRDRVRTLRAKSLDERDRVSAARLSLTVAKLFAFYEPKAEGKVKEALDRCLLLSPAMPEALDFIIAQALQANDPASAATRLEALAQVTQERGAKVELWVRAGTLRLSHLADTEGAQLDFLRAASADASRPDAFSLALELLLESGKHGDAARLLEQHIPSVPDRTLQTRLRLELASLYSGPLDAPEQAQAQLARVLEREPAHPQASLALVELLVHGAHPASAERFLEAALLGKPNQAERVALCLSLADACEQAGDTDAAAACVAQALKIQPGMDQLGRAERLAQKSPDTVALLAVALRRAAGMVESSVSPRFYRGLARVLTLHPEGNAEAAWAWGEVLARVPDDAEAAAAVQALAKPKTLTLEEKLAEHEARAAAVQAQSPDPAAALGVYRAWLADAPADERALQGLGAAASTLGRWDEVAQVAEQLAKHAVDPAERMRWRVRRAQLDEERLEQPQRAAQALLQLVQEGAVLPEVIQSLEQLAARGVERPAILAALGPHYARVGDPQRQAANLLHRISVAAGSPAEHPLLVELAELEEQTLADGKAALDTWLQLLARAPEHVLARTQAARLGRDLGLGADVARALFAAAGSVSEAEVAQALALEAAGVAEASGALEGADRGLRETLERFRDAPALLERRVRVLLAQGRAPEAAEVLRRRILVAEEEEKAELFVRLTELEAALEHPAAAAEALERALLHGADEAEHVGRLVALWEQAEQPVRLAAALEREATLAQKLGDVGRASRAELRRGQVLHQAVGGRADAVQSFAQVLQRRPTDPDALAGLEQLLGEPTAGAAAARVLIPHYERMQEHRRLTRVLTVLADASEPAEQLALRKKEADVYLNYLRQPEQALRALEKALAVGSPGLETAPCGRGRGSSPSRWETPPSTRTSWKAMPARRHRRCAAGSTASWRTSPSARSRTGPWRGATWASPSRPSPTTSMPCRRCSACCAPTKPGPRSPRCWSSWAAPPPTRWSKSPPSAPPPSCTSSACSTLSAPPPRGGKWRSVSRGTGKRARRWSVSTPSSTSRRRSPSPSSCGARKKGTRRPAAS